MRHFSTTLAIALSLLLLVSITSAQQTPTTSVPNLIRYSGTLKDAQGAAISSAEVGVTFTLYKQQDGGAAVWLETQNVTPDSNGQYNVVLGSTTAKGLPTDLFSQQEERWLGVQVQGQAEQPRVLLVSVPYAFKAYEAETLGGLPASAFVKAATPDASNGTSVISLGTVPNAAGASKATGASPSPKGPCGTLTGGPGATDFVAIWDSTGCNLTDTPGSGTAQINGNLNLGPNGISSVLMMGDVTVLRATEENLYLGRGTGPLDAGISNTFVGPGAGNQNTSGGGNSFVGFYAGTSNTGGHDNSFFGSAAGISSSLGNYNSFFGGGAGQQSRTGSQNSFFGYDAGANNGTGSNNIYIGASAGSSVGSGSNNVEIGNQGSSTDNNTIRIGTQGTQTSVYMAGIFGNKNSNLSPVLIDANGRLWQGITSSQVVTSFNGRIGAVTSQTGDYSFSMLSAGSNSNQVTLSNPSNLYYGNGSNLTGLVVGPGSPFYIQNGTSLQTNANFHISGNGAAQSFNSTTNYQIGGTSVLSTDGNNLFVGADAGTSGLDSTFVGTSAGNKNFEGSDNTFIGWKAGFANDSDRNTFTGSEAGENNVGESNTFTGFAAGHINTNGSANTFIGLGAGGHNTTGSNNVFLGYLAGDSTGAGSNNIEIGNEGSSGESNTIRIGNQGAQTSTYIAGIFGSSIGGSGIAVYVDSNGQLGTTVSSLRFKEHVLDMGDSSSKLFQLRPVTFFYKPPYDDGSHLLQYGLIAEEVAKVYPDMVAYDKDGQPYTVKYQLLAPMLLNEVQKQQKVVTGQQQQIEQMQQRLAQLEAVVAQLTQAAAQK